MEKVDKIWTIPKLYENSSVLPLDLYFYKQIIMNKAYLDYIKSNKLIIFMINQ